MAHVTKAVILSCVMRKLIFDYAKIMAKISFPVTAKLISAFVFATRIELSHFLNLKFPSSVLVQLGLCQTWLETQKTGFTNNAVHFYPTRCLCVGWVSYHGTDDAIKCCNSYETEKTTSGSDGL